MLRVLDLSVLIGQKKVLSNINFSLKQGEIVGLVGKSGSGKSSLAKACANLLPKGAELSGKVESQGRIGIIFQDPSSALNPVLKIQTQFLESLQMGSPQLSKQEKKEEAVRLLQYVGIVEPYRVLSQYPHQLSGGTKQRILIALSLALKPTILIADEPTTALDTITQAKILDLFTKIWQDGISILLISHDLGVIAQLSERLLVIDAGKLIEEGPLQSILRKPQHPVTQELISAARSFYD